MAPSEGGETKQFEEPYKWTYLDEPNTPLFAFGFGLSYTTFAYRDLMVETPARGLDGTLVVHATIENTETQAGEEVAQLYVHDLVAGVSRPGKELKGFQHVALQPGESQIVRCEVPAHELGFFGSDMQYAVHPTSGYNPKLGSLAPAVIASRPTRARCGDAGQMVAA